MDEVHLDFLDVHEVLEVDEVDLEANVVGALVVDELAVLTV